MDKRIDQLKQSKQQGKRISHRVWLMAICFLCLMSLYIGRLAWLQLYTHSAYMKRTAQGVSVSSVQLASSKQRQRSLEMDSGRGHFYDRHGHPLTGEKYEAAAFFPLSDQTRIPEVQLRQLVEALGVKKEELLAWWRQLEAPAYWTGAESKSRVPMQLSEMQRQVINRLAMRHVFVLPYRNRYPGSIRRIHAIGFVSQHPELLVEQYGKELTSGRRKLTDEVGGYGLEKTLEHWLKSRGSIVAAMNVDALGMPFQGEQLRVKQPVNSYYPIQVHTTLDLDIQQAIDTYAAKSGIQEGAIVVLDAATADIVAMSSYPQLPMEGFSTSDGSQWENHAIKAIAPGSIFKLVTAAAALEYGVTTPKERFYCNGKYSKYGLHCWKKEGHGELTVQQGLAQSCNIVFATLGERLTPDMLEQTAHRLGIGRRVSWLQTERNGLLPADFRLLEEEAGTLFTSQPDGGVMAQSGIGQRDVRLSPLQAANLIVTLLHQGQPKAPRIVSDMRYANGQPLTNLPVINLPQEKQQLLRSSTIQVLLGGMESAVQHGTGRGLLGSTWRLAGKSGTAQTGDSLQAPYHQWFIGYGPVQNPRYAVAVVVKNQRQGSANQATKLFRGVMDILAEQSSQAKHEN